MTREGLADALGTLLQELIRAYSKLCELSHEHRDAIRRASPGDIARVNREQESVLAQLAALEQRRRELVAHSWNRFPALAGKRAMDVTLSDLARCTPPERSPMLLQRAEELRALVREHRVRAESVLSATRGLLDHAQGLLHQFTQALSHAGTYSRRGVVEAAPGVMSALDVRL